MRAPDHSCLHIKSLAGDQPHGAQASLLGAAPRFEIEVEDPED